MEKEYSKAAVERAMKVEEVILRKRRTTAKVSRIRYEDGGPMLDGSVWRA